MYPKVAIIILNWNGWKDTLECLESLYQITYPNYDVIVVDNGSLDKSIDKIKEYAEGKLKIKSNFFQYDPKNKPISYIEYRKKEAELGARKDKRLASFPSNRKIVIIKNEKNYGFAEGSNVGIKYAMKALKPDYILLLNNDTVIVNKQVLRKLIKIAESDQRVGMLGPKICYYSNPEIIWAAGGKINFFTGSIMNIGDCTPRNRYTGIRRVDYVSGCMLLIKREVIEKIGLLDSRYFMYFEDTDLGIRAKRAGYISLVDCDVKILHKSGASIKKTSYSNYYYFPRNKLLFMKKNGKWYHFIIFLPIFLARFASMFLFNLIKRNYTRCINILRGIKDFMSGRFGEL
jgi:hypothetical protein